MNTKVIEALKTLEVLSDEVNTTNVRAYGLKVNIHEKWKSTLINILETLKEELTVKEA